MFGTKVYGEKIKFGFLDVKITPHFLDFIAIGHHRPHPPLNIIMHCGLRGVDWVFGDIGRIATQILTFRKGRKNEFNWLSLFKIFFRFENAFYLWVEITANVLLSKNGMTRILKSRVWLWWQGSASEICVFQRENTKWTTMKKKTFDFHSRWYILVTKTISIFSILPIWFDMRDLATSVMAVIAALIWTVRMSRIKIKTRNMFHSVEAYTQTLTQF